MAKSNWNEDEVKATVSAYFDLLKKQEEGVSPIKVGIYKNLSKRFPHRTPKAFEYKFQNISAILYEEKQPYANGLKPKDRYQRLLKLFVLDYLGRIRRPTILPIQILVKKLRGINQLGPCPIKGKGSGRFGLTLESNLGIPQNSSKAPDFMGIELKTKHSANLHTLFSKIPSRYINVSGKKEILNRFGKYDKKNHQRTLYTSFNNISDGFGFSLLVKQDFVVVMNLGIPIMEYDFETLEESLLSKHSESAFIKVMTEKSPGMSVKCKFPSLMYCKGPSILRFLKMIKMGQVYLDFTMSVSNGRHKNHGFLWRVHKDNIGNLYLHSEEISLL